MSGQESSGEKTFAPTDKRKRDAARKGDVLRSKDLATAAAILAGTAWMVLAGPWLMRALIQTLRAAFIWDRADLDAFTPGRLIGFAMMGVLPPVLVLGALVLIASLVSQLGFGTGVWVPGNIAPKASRLNPLSGLSRMFGVNGLIEIGKGLAKIALLGAIAWVWAQNRIDDLYGLMRGELAGQAALAWRAITTLLFALGGGLVVIALIDVPVQWLRRNKRLKMTLQEIRDEHKESDGAPEKKAAIRERQRALAMGALRPALREAQFVITNPTHFSVALAYDPLKAHAPVAVAKGRGEKALAMRELAAEMDVPLLEYPALARSVYFTTREKQVIREELFVAVAAVLAFVLSLRRGEKPLRPQVVVPTALRFDTHGRQDPAANA